MKCVDLRMRPHARMGLWLAALTASYFMAGSTQYRQTDMNDIECCKCGWIGDEEEQVIAECKWMEVKGAIVESHVCPKCGHDEFYDVED